MLIDTTRRRRYEAAARIRAVSLYDWTAVSAETAAAYLSVVRAARAEVSA